MKKSIVFTIIVTLFVACNTNNPEKNKLLGTWSEPYHVTTNVKSITFNKDSLLFIEEPDTTWPIVFQWGGIDAKMKYVVQEDKLYFSGIAGPFDYGEEAIPFAFSSGYSIEREKLTIDSFSYDGGTRTRFYKPFILYKK